MTHQPGPWTMFRENNMGEKFTSFAHHLPDGTPTASSFGGWLSAKECWRIVETDREKVAQ